MIEVLAVLLALKQKNKISHITGAERFLSYVYKTNPEP